MEISASDLQSLRPVPDSRRMCSCYDDLDRRPSVMDGNGPPLPEYAAIFRSLKRENPVSLSTDEVAQLRHITS